MKFPYRVRFGSRFRQDKDSSSPLHRDPRNAKGGSEPGPHQTGCEILKAVSDPLEGVAGAILQAFGRKRNLIVSSLVGKGAGAATATGLTGAVSAFGTASTGTAISTLYGAAATNATLAWIGGLVGGGMLAGSLVVGGVGIAAGAGAVYYLKGRSRKQDKLSERELRLLNVIREILPSLRTRLDEGGPLSATEVTAIRSGILRPLVEELDAYIDGEAKENLKLFHWYRLNRARSKLAVLDARLRVVPAASGLNANGSAAIAGVLLGLLQGSDTIETVEGLLVLEAVRRSSDHYANLSLEDIGDELRNMSVDQLRGFASNVKGIYHEMVFVRVENTDEDGITAELHPSTNHPGGDVLLFRDGELIGEIQLKATNAASALAEHVQRYPDIPALVTEELAADLHFVDGSGFSNADLSEDVKETLSDLADTGNATATIATSGMAGGLIAAALNAHGLLRGKTTLSEGCRRVAEAAGIAALTAAVVQMVFG